MRVNASHLARIDLNLLLLFALLYEERVAGRVAQRLNLTPSAVSHSLRRLRQLFNDPLFLAGSRGLTPTARANELAPAVREIVERVARVVDDNPGFDPSNATRRFRIGAPDGVAWTVLPPLIEQFEAGAPNVDLAFLQLLPRPGAGTPQDAWRDALDLLDSCRIDLAILPHKPPQARFHACALYAEDFVFVCRPEHPVASAPSFESLAAARHVLVSAAGDSGGFVDVALAEHGYRRRVALTVPSFLLALEAVSRSELISALPRRFARKAAQVSGVEVVEPPIPLGSSELYAVVLHAAMLDSGISWLLETLRSSV